MIKFIDNKKSGAEKKLTDVAIGKPFRCGGFRGMEEGEVGVFVLSQTGIEEYCLFRLDQEHALSNRWCKLNSRVELYQTKITNFEYVDLEIRVV